MQPGPPEWLGAYGGYVEWANPTQYTTVDGGFTDQTLWVYTYWGTCCWVEIGISKGWQGNNSIWTFYWAENTCPNYVNCYHEHRIFDAIGNTGVVHSYEVQYTAYRQFTAYIDFVAKGVSSQPPGVDFMEVGGEVTSASNTLTITAPQYMQCLEPGYVWRYWKDCGGTLPPYPHDHAPFDWHWLDSQYKFGYDHKH